MFKNYFKMAWRSLIRNKVSSIVNIGGLSVGLATGIIILLVIVNELSYDTFHSNLTDIYMLMKNEDMNGNIVTGRATSGMLAGSVHNEIPEVKYTARTSQESQELLRSGDKSMYENGIYADPDFFNIMSFPALEGNPASALHEPNSIVITERTAKKFFGKEEAIGKILVHNNIHPLKVAAVIRDVPENSSNQFDVVLSFKLYEQENNWLTRWDYNSIHTWVQAKPAVKADALNAKLKKLYLEKTDIKNTLFFAYPFAALRLHSGFKNGKPSGGIIEIVLLLSIIGAFVLLIACINFMNLATARSEHRAREVGVRKVLGASRMRIIIQFLGEAMLLSFIALLIGVIAAHFALPVFMRLSGRNFVPDYTNWQVWTLLITLGLVTGLLAGSYPAFYLSRFNPVRVLKGLTSRENGSGLLRKGLVTFQFVISIFLIIATLVIYKQIHHIETRPMGYHPDNLIEIPARGDMANKFSVVKNELLQIPGIKHISAGSDNLVRFGGAFNGLEWPGKTADQDFYITSTYVQYDWIRTAGLTLAEGRDFSAAFGADTANCLINQAAVKRMNLKEPVIGTRLGSNMVIGVVNDFVFNNPASAPSPMIMFLSKGSMSHFFIRVNNDENWQASVSQIEKAIKNVNPNYPFEFRFTREEYQKSFQQIRSVGQMSNVFGVMAIFISCLGLFGLSAFLAERRSKEVSIRKVLGASVNSIWFSLSKDFLKPVFIAFAIAVPLGAWVMQKVLDGFDYHTQLTWWMFLLAGAMAIIIALITISFNGLKAAFANPVKNLKNE